MPYSIRIEGVDKLIAKLGKVQGIAVLRKPMQRAVYRLHAGLAKYPSAIPGSSYRRTGTLGRLWTTRIESSSDGLTGKVGNRIHYAPWVQSERFQAKVHQGRWQTEVNVAEKETPAIVADFERAIREALR